MSEVPPSEVPPSVQDIFLKTAARRSAKANENLTTEGFAPYVTRNRTPVSFSSGVGDTAMSSLTPAMVHESSASPQINPLDKAQKAAAQKWESQRPQAASAAPETGAKYLSPSPATTLSSTPADVNNSGASYVRSWKASAATPVPSSVDAPPHYDPAAGVRDASSRADSPSLASLAVATESDLPPGWTSRPDEEGNVFFLSPRGMPTRERPIADLPSGSTKSVISSRKVVPSASDSTAPDSYSNYFIKPWSDHPWYNESLNTTNSVNKVITASINFNSKISDSLYQRPKNGAIVSLDITGKVNFYPYDDFKTDSDMTGKSWNDKDRELDEILQPRSKGLLGQRRVPLNVISLLSKKSVPIGLCDSTCDEGVIDMAVAEYLKGKVGLSSKGAYKEGNRLICVKNKGTKKVNPRQARILFFTLSSGGNLFFSGKVLFDTTGEYIGPAGTGSLLRKRDDGIFEVITGFFRGDWILKMSEQNPSGPSYDINGRFCQYAYTSTSTSTCELVGMASGDVTWEFKSPITKDKNTDAVDGGFNPYNTNLTFVNWNFGNSENVLNIAQNDIYAHASTSDEVLCTAFNMNGGRFMFVTKKGYSETDKKINKKTLFKFRYKPKSSFNTFCIELIHDGIGTNIENVVYLRVYTLVTGEAVQRRAGLSRKQVEVNKVNKKLLAIELKNGKITAMGLSTLSAANAVIGTIIDDYGKVYQLKGAKWEVTDSLSNTYTTRSGNSFDMCRKQQSQVDENYVSNLADVQKCYNEFFGMSTTTPGAFNLAILKLNVRSLSIDFADTSEHTVVYYKLQQDISNAKILAENVLKTALKVQLDIKHEQEKAFWDFGNWGSGKPAVEPIIPTEGSVRSENSGAPAAVIIPSITPGCIAKVSDEYDGKSLAGKHVIIDKYNDDDRTWTIMGGRRISARLLTFVVNPPHDINMEGGITILINALNNRSSIDDAIREARNALLNSTAAAAPVAAAAAAVRPHSFKGSDIAFVARGDYGEDFNRKHVAIHTVRGDSLMVTNYNNTTIKNVSPSDLDFLYSLNRLKPGANIQNMLGALDRRASVDRFLKVPAESLSPHVELPLPEGKLEAECIAMVTGTTDQARVGQLVYLHSKNEDNTWTVSPIVGKHFNIEESLLAFHMTPKDAKSIIQSRADGVTVTAAWNVLLNPPPNPADVPGASDAAPVITPTLEKWGIAQVSSTYFNEPLRNKHVYLQWLMPNGSWNTWQSVDPNNVDIDQSFLTPVRSKADTDPNNIYDILAKLDAAAAAAAPASHPPAPVITPTLEMGGIAQVSIEYSGPNERLRNKHVYLTTLKNGNTWVTFNSDRGVANIEQGFLTPVRSKADTDPDRSRIVDILAELDRGTDEDFSGGRRGTRKYKGRRGNNVRRRLTRKVKGQAGGGGRRGSGRGSKRRGGKMYRKTMKHVRRGRGGRKGRKGHRRTIKKYHRR